MNYNFPDTRLLLSQFLVQRYQTEMLLKFAQEEGILRLLESIDTFHINEAIEALQNKLNYQLQDRLRRRMIHTLIYLLQECGYLSLENTRYQWHMIENAAPKLKDEEYKIIEVSFKGVVGFFEECIKYSGDFLRGATPRFNFNAEFTSIWESFLGNAEFNFARSILIELLMFEKKENSNILVLCFGPGFDLVKISERFSNVKLFGLDFAENFYDKAKSKLSNSHTIEWVRSDRWKGFGFPLPFQDNCMEVVFFGCADPYIPVEKRRYAYKEIFRVLKHEGSLGILTNSYPDQEKKYVKDKWIRLGILAHDFCESVCEGWQGFHEAMNSIKLFKEIGYHTNTVMLNASIWRLDKP